MNRSEYNEITTGVPQGTILGPILFILYVNDLLNHMPNETIMSYADDTVIIYSDNTWSSAQDKMCIYLNYVASWLVFNKLTLNINKTIYMTFGSYCHSVPNALNIKLDNQSIERVEAHKYLGLIFDYNMKWDAHIKYIVKKTKYLIFIFAKIKNIIETKTLMIMYYALFHSILNYGIIAWGGAYSNNVNLVENIQKKILKIINKNQFS